MLDKYPKAKIICWIYIFLLNFLTHGCVQGEQNLDETKLGSKPKGTIKTIKNLENGNVIDCVNIYKQPAFDDTRIKDLQMEPSSYPGGKYNIEKYPELYQTWRKYGECPQGTIPIRRTLTKNTHPIKFQVNSEQHEYATVSQPIGIYYGGFGAFNVWNPKTESREFSCAQIWVASGTYYPNTVNSIEAGWVVYPHKYGDNKTRLFIHWTADGYNKTGCSDLDCPGFVHTSRKIALGSPIEPVSTYGGKQKGIYVYIFKDEAAKKWWFQANDETIGYWPFTLFNYLQEHAESVSWGGEIVNLKPWWHHTTTQMGSGHFPFQGYGKAAFIRNLQVVNASNVMQHAFNVKKNASNRRCYDVTIGPNGTSYDTHFYFGGPGYSYLCK